LLEFHTRVRKLGAVYEGHHTSRQAAHVHTHQPVEDLAPTLGDGEQPTSWPQDLGLRSNPKPCELNPIRGMITRQTWLGNQILQN
jgi:hypothetical protein